MATPMESDNSENHVRKLSTQLAAFGGNTRIFSVAIRSLYAEEAVGSLSEIGVEFNALRDEIRNDALVYTEAILPLSVTYVRYIREFFEEYQALGFKDWRKCMDNTVEEVKGYRQFCESLLYMHEQIMTQLKEKQDKAKVLVKQLTATSDDFKIKVEQLENASSFTSKLMSMLTVVPFPILSIICLTLEAHGDNERCRAVALKAESKIYGAASCVVNAVMIPALAAFLDALKASTAFFAIMEQSLTSFQGNATKAQKQLSKRKRKALMRRHYTVMKNAAAEIYSRCDSFFAVVPDVRTDLAAIPKEGTDTNHVQDWLEKRKNAIRQRFRGQITELVQSAILGLESEDMAYMG